VDDVSLVVNYHLPEEAATYVHRIGRTARAGRQGIAVSICGAEDAYSQIRVEEYLGSKIPVEWFGENELPQDVKFPRRDEEDHDEEEESEAGPRGRAPRQGRERDRGGRERGRREDRGRGRRDDKGREHGGSRGPRVERAAQAPVVEPAPAPEAVAPATEAPEPTPRVQSPQREGRERGGRERDNRSGRGPRGRRDRFRERDRERGAERRAEESVSAADMPSPLTGNPVVYCMKTGKPKNRSAEEFRQEMEHYNSKLQMAEDKFAGRKKAAPAIIKKISSKVTALFGNRGK
jgi:superfamily II DNA/RNA helicase